MHFILYTSPMEKSCSVKGCTRPYRARGFCITHYSEARKAGELELIKPRRVDDLCAKCRKNPRTGRGTNAYCRECHAEYNRVKRQSLSDAERADLNARAKLARIKDPDRFRGYYLKKYNLTLDKYREMLAEQGGGCAICNHVPDEGQWLHIDHDHACCPEKLRSCGECVRGLLCNGCNNGLGRFKDSTNLLLRAAEYLETTPNN